MAKHLAKRVHNMVKKFAPSHDVIRKHRQLSRYLPQQTPSKKEYKTIIPEQLFLHKIVNT
jgi:hypothetical protein